LELQTADLTILFLNVGKQLYNIDGQIKKIIPCYLEVLQSYVHTVHREVSKLHTILVCPSFP